MARRAFAGLLAATMVGAALGPAARAELGVEEILQVLPGLWEAETPAGASDEENTTRCGETPLEIAITGSDEGLVYEGRFVGFPDGDHRSLIQTTPLAIRVQYDGEQRLTPDGEPVAWFLLMPDRNSFYWVREDWARSTPGARTSMWRRCQGPIA